MGVRSLTTFLHENRQALSRTTILHAADGSSPPIPLVVDAWGLIYALYFPHLQWTTGGDYLEFARLVERTIYAWRAVGLEPVFIFDGPTPPIKFETELQRAEAGIYALSLFHLTSPESRSSPSYTAAGSVLLPPLLYSATVDIVRLLGVESLWAEAEADTACVFEARRRRAFLTGLDSDFVVFGGDCEAEALGYVPMDEMVWASIDSTPKQSASVPDADAFVPVKGRRVRRTGSAYRKNTPLPPPVPHVSFISSLTITSYHPSLLAERLKFPPSLLPLFASLVGNDYVQFASHFHPRDLSGVQKIERVATALRESLAPSKKAVQKLALATRRGTASPATFDDDPATLLARTVQLLLQRPLAEAQMDEINHALIDSALSYALPLSLSSLSLTPSATAPASPYRNEVALLLGSAMAEGNLAPKLAGVIRDGRYLGRVWLEDSTRGTIGRRVGDPIRRLCWALLHEGLGIGFTDEQSAPSPMPASQVDNTVEELDVWGGNASDRRSQSEDGPVEDLGADTLSQQPLPSSKPTFEHKHLSDSPSPNVAQVQTYLRSSSLILPKLVPVASMVEILSELGSHPLLPSPLPAEPVLLQDSTYRSRLFLALTGSLTSGVLEIEGQFRPLVVALRWVLRVTAEDAKGGMKWRLQRAEVDALVLAGVRSLVAWRAWEGVVGTFDLAGNTNEETASLTPLPRISNRIVHVTSHLLHAFHELDLLAQALLLPRSIFRPPHQFYSGRTYLSLLSQLETTPISTLAATSEWEQHACCSVISAVLDVDGLSWLAPAPVAAPCSSAETNGEKKARKRARKEREKEKQERNPGERGTSVPGERGSALSGGLFDILSSLGDV